MQAKGMMIWIGTIATLVATGAQARPEPNAFLNKPATTLTSLVAQVSKDAVVTDRYMRHFSMTKQDVINYFSTLRRSTLTTEGVYSVYNVPDSGVLRARYFRLRKGTKVWVDFANEPILKESCGNPMTKGPNRRNDEEVTVYDLDTDPKTTVEEPDEVWVKKQALEPKVPELDQTVFATTEPSLPEGSTVQPPTYSTRPALPFFLVLIPPLLIGLNPPPRYNTPPPVPEPASFLAMGIGVAGIFGRRLKRRSR